MKVKVIKAKYPTLWYAGAIGAVFRVHRNDGNVSLYVVENTDAGIFAEDCESIPEVPETTTETTVPNRGKYEYRTVHAATDDIYGIDDELKCQAEHGWRLVCMHKNLVIFEREV